MLGLSVVLRLDPALTLSPTADPLPNPNLSRNPNPARSSRLSPTFPRELFQQIRERFDEPSAGHDAIDAGCAGLGDGVGIDVGDESDHLPALRLFPGGGRLDGALEIEVC